ncbi:hypothetical protein SAMN05192576_3014 [Nocardioides szechwanensis]|uniref:PASTA domain-containing protein n=1 Tax=Nocardioides szechwanensis TaxID=1005944 RepID=A0A1H0FEQ1_9ACTN|nr:hypothetical protein [Nocardioides szechwanensis]SDN93110.1 hypothetical protein SAMN05192576_3014 [Nocardioides szechwanensis]
MRTLPALLCLAALAFTAGCTSDDEPERPDEPTTVTLTGEERDAFVAEVEDLGFTCRDAVPETDRHVACTRPGAYPEAADDTVRLSSTPDGATVTRLAYCGPEERVVTAVSDAFLGEVGSPDLLTEIPTLDGVRLQPCAPGTSTGIALGQGMPYLRQLEVDLLNRGLTRAGWTCLEELTVDCRPPGRDGTVVRGDQVEVVVTAPTPKALAAATRVLALSPVVSEAAEGCAPDSVCDHLVVDGFDMFFEATGDTSQLRIQVRRDF